MSWLYSVCISRILNTAWPLIKPLRLVAIGIVIVGFILVASLGSRSKRAIGLSEECQIPAIYNFGDSNSDTGCVSAAFGRVPYPNGITFFGKLSGRNCDGRLIIDFIGEFALNSFLSLALSNLFTASASYT